MYMCIYIHVCTYAWRTFVYLHDYACICNFIQHTQIANPNTVDLETAAVTATAARRAGLAKQ